MRGLILAAACVYASRSHAPAILRHYFDVLLAETLIGYAVLYFFGDTSRVYTYVYCVVVLAVVLASFAVALLYCTIQERSMAMLLVCGSIGATCILLVARLVPLDKFGWIMGLEGGSFLAAGILMAACVGCAPTAPEKLVAAVFAANWLAKAGLDFALIAGNFSPRLLEAGAVLPWAFFLSSAVVVGYSFRHKIA